MAVRRLKGTGDVAVSFVVTVLLPGAAATGIRHPGVTLTEAYNRDAVIRGTAPSSALPCAGKPGAASS